MSLHAMDHPEGLIEALQQHGLPHNTPSQNADCFRLGWTARTGEFAPPTHHETLLNDALFAVLKASGLLADHVKYLSGPEILLAAEDLAASMQNPSPESGHPDLVWENVPFGFKSVAENGDRYEVWGSEDSGVVRRNDLQVSGFLGKTGAQQYANTISEASRDPSHLNLGL